MPAWNWDRMKGAGVGGRLEAFLPFYHFLFNTFSWSCLMPISYYVPSTTHRHAGRAMNRTGMDPALPELWALSRRKSKSYKYLFIENCAIYTAREVLEHWEPVTAGSLCFPFLFITTVPRMASTRRKLTTTQDALLRSLPRYNLGETVLLLNRDFLG